MPFDMQNLRFCLASYQLKKSDKEIVERSNYQKQYGVLSSFNKFLKEVKNTSPRKI